jgi:hypothetical protein
MAQILTTRKILGDTTTKTISKWAKKPLRMVVEHTPVRLNGKDIIESRTRHIPG